MSKFLVYLAGAIGGISYKEATKWREYASNDLSAMSDGKIVCLSPMRYKEKLSQESSMADFYSDVMCNQRTITARDRFDVGRCDLMLVNFIGARTRSIGTLIEIGWANCLRKPIVLAMEDNNVHEDRKSVV